MERDGGGYLLSVRERDGTSAAAGPVTFISVKFSSNGWKPTADRLPRAKAEVNVSNVSLTVPAGTVMARTGSGALLSRRNIKLDSFLKRNTERTVYERIRAYEPCVVISETVNKVYMHVVLSDERVYLTEYPPRTLTTAFSFRRVRDIELVSLQEKPNQALLSFNLQLKLL